MVYITLSQEKLTWLKTRTNCPYAATFWDIYFISPRIYIYINTYIHIYKYIYTYIYMFYSYIFWQHFHWGCYTWKSLKILFFGKFKNKIFIFEYFPKIHSEMNSTHPYYSILIPNTPYVIFFSFCFRGSLEVN